MHGPTESLTNEQSQISELRERTQKTYRASAPELEEILYQPLPVLDHGFVRVVDYMGSDSAVVQAARVSYGAGTKKTSEDAGLINYLMRHYHSTPFEMCEIKLHVKLPIFVARQWIRHRTANVNEYSARYSIMDKEFYVPDRDMMSLQTKKKKAATSSQVDMFVMKALISDLAAQSSTNKQGREDSALEETEALEAIKLINSTSSNAYKAYVKLLNEDAAGSVVDENRKGIARELARMVLPVNYYTQWYWKIDLHNLLHFLRLRADPHAQAEIRAYADVICDVVKRWVPLTYEAFTQHRMGGMHLSEKALQAVKRMLNGEKVDQKESGLSAREWRETMDKLGVVAK